MTGRVADDPHLARLFQVQAGHCTRMHAPFNGRVCQLLADTLDDRSALGRRVLQWPKGNRGGDLVPLRCCAGFHALARARRVPALTTVYPPHACDDNALRRALADAVDAEDAFLAAYLDSAPQTNEIGRSAILLGGLLTIARQLGKPIALFEIGASAGLNMQFDRWHYDLGDGRTFGTTDAAVRLACPWTGAAPAPDAPLRVASRVACDLAPLDPSNAKDRERLLSYIWPDQTERLARTIAAFDIAAASGFRVEQSDARDWVARRLAPANAQTGTVSVLFHSVFIQYLDPPTRAALIAEIKERGAMATVESPFAWLCMESNPDNREGCELRLTVWPSGETHRLSDVDWHGRSAHWH